MWPGSAITVREDSKLKQKQHNESRRQAIYLNLDDNYRKFEVDLTSQLLQKKDQDKWKQDTAKHLVQQPTEDQNPHLFSMNVDNFLRNKTLKEDVQTSFVEKELTAISKKIHKQKAIQNAIDNDFLLSQPHDQPHKDYHNHITETQIKLSKQHQQFKTKMEQTVRDFKDYLREDDKKDKDDDPVPIPKQDKKPKPPIRNTVTAQQKTRVDRRETTSRESRSAKISTRPRS